jgi:hypothetical protein
MSIDTDKLKDRKEKLEAELQLLQTQLETTMQDIRGDVTARANPLYWIKKYPLPMVGAAFAAGLLISVTGNKKDDNGNGNRNGAGRAFTFGALLAVELKRVASQKLVGFLVNAYENQFERKK